MKYLLPLLLLLTTQAYAEYEEGRKNNYFTPIKVSNQKQFNYILDNLIISAAMANELKKQSKVTSQILEDYDSVLRYKYRSCNSYEINKTLDDFFKTNKEFARRIDKIRVETFVALAKLSDIEISGCDAIHRTYFNNMLQKKSK